MSSFDGLLLFEIIQKVFSKVTFLIFLASVIFLGGRTALTPLDQWWMSHPWNGNQNFSIFNFFFTGLGTLAGMPFHPWGVHGEISCPVRRVYFTSLVLYVLALDATKNLWRRKCVRRAIFRNVDFLCNTSNCVTVRLLRSHLSPKMNIAFFIRNLRLNIFLFNNFFEKKL